MIELRDITVQSGTFCLSKVRVHIPTGVYAVLMGPSGEGKTTLLEAICGLRPVTAGEVLIAGKPVTTLSPGARGIGYVPQDLALFPSMTVAEHLEFPLKIRKQPPAVIRERVHVLAVELELQPLLSRRIQQLSGGEAQRVALGRALSFQPRVLLLDEPLTGLDRASHARLIELLRRLHHQHGTTTLHVTHTVDEARELAQQLHVIEQRQITARPLTDLDRPGSTTSAVCPATP
jgi:ABC-type sugar transport system ATPase subunit